jgi:hypothetical protein
MSVGVGPDMECASACVILFAAGKTRLVRARSAIGVHQASTEDANGKSSDTPAALEGSKMMTAAFIHYNVPFTVIREMASTDGNKDSWLTFKDLLNWHDTIIIGDDGTRQYQ